MYQPKYILYCNVMCMAASIPVQHYGVHGGVATVIIFHRISIFDQYSLVIVTEASLPRSVGFLVQIII